MPRLGLLSAMGLAIIGLGSVAPGTADAQTDPVWTFEIAGPSPNEPATPCAPAGSLWRDLAAYETRPADDAPTLHVSLGTAQGRVWSASGEAADPFPFALTDTSGLFRAAGLPIPAGDYLGVILPPGGNSSLFAEEPAEDAPSPTGRAGAIFLLPAGDRTAFCATHGVGGYVIHAAGPDDAGTLDRLPSLVMKEDDLAQLSANLIARSGPALPLLGRPYEEIGPANAGIEGGRGLRAFGVRVMRADTVPAETVAVPPLPVPALMTYNELLGIRRQVAEGWRSILNDFRTVYDEHAQVAGSLYQLQFEPNLDVRRKAILDSAGNFAEIEGKLLTHLAVLEQARDSGDIPANQVSAEEIDGAINTVRGMLSITRGLHFETADAMAMLERLTAEGKIDPEAEFNLPSVDTGFQGCVLDPHVRPLPAFQQTLFGYPASLSGRAAVYFTRDPALPEAFRTHIRMLLNVNDLIRMQEQAVRANLPEDNCNLRSSVRDSRLYPDPAGRLNGRVRVYARWGACYSYKYPCWKRWKTYMCKHKSWAQLGSHTEELAVAIAASPQPRGFELRLSGITSGSVLLDPAQWTGQGPVVQQASSILNIRPRRAFFSEDAASNLWFVVELSGDPKLASAVCAFQDVLRQQGGL